MLSGILHTIFLHFHVYLGRDIAFHGGMQLLNVQDIISRGRKAAEPGPAASVMFIGFIGYNSSIST